MKFSLNSKLIIPDTTLFQELDGETVILNLSNESYYGLDETATRMWTVLAESESISAACTTLIAEYDVDKDTLLSDICKFVDELLENQMVQISGQ